MYVYVCLYVTAFASISSTAFKYGFKYGLSRSQSIDMEETSEELPNLSIGLTF